MRTNYVQLYNTMLLVSSELQVNQNLIFWEIANPELFPFIELDTNPLKKTWLKISSKITLSNNFI